MKTKSFALIAAIALGSLAAPAGRAQDMDSFAPVVIKTVPEAGSRNVAPGEYEVKVTFSKPMRDRSWSWSTVWEDSTPEMVGQPHYDADHKTCVLKVKLEPGKTYGWWLNSQKFTNFKDQQGHAAVPYLLTFQCAMSAGASASAAGPHINPATGMMETGPDDFSSANVMTSGYKVSGEVKDLIASGRYDDALQRCLDFHDKYKSANGSLIPLLGDWVELGRRYPKAKTALLDIRDRDVREFAEGRGYFDLFSEVNSINGYLHQEDATYDLYQSIRDKDPGLEAQCYVFVEGMLVARGEYQAYYDHIGGDAQGKFDSIHQMFSMQQDNLKRMAEQNQRTAKMIADLNKKNGFTNSWTPPDTSGMMKRTAENSFVGQVRQLIEVLVGTGHKADAEKIRDEAVAVLDDPRLQSAVSDAEKKIHGRQAATGASSGTSDSQEADAQLQADLKARIIATESMTAFPDRDAALAVIAKDAARAGDVEDARTALKKVTAFPTKDTAICESARLLVAAGKRADALELAKLITAFPTRDALIAELAK